MPPNIEICGWVDDAEERIADAGIVVGGAGDGVVAAVLAHKKPFVCLPEPRPYDEQMVKAARLAALGAATIAYEWPDALQWAGLLVAAQSCVARWPVELDTPGGAGPVAHWLAEIARCVSRNRDFVH
jgi:predicted glycosyltransferase